MKAKLNLLVNCFASKFVLMLGMVFLSVSSAFAQQAFDKTSKLPLYFDGPEITVGQANTLSLMLENQTGVASLELLVQLPDGVDFGWQQSSNYFVGNEARIPSNMFQLFIDPVRNSSNLYKIILFNAYPNIAIKDGKDKMLAKLTFNVSPYLLNQKNPDIKVSEVYLSDLNGKRLYKEEYADKSFSYSLAPKAAKLSFNNEKSAVCVGDTVSLNVSMDNKWPVRDLEFNVSLPEGLSVAKDENGLYMFKRAARLPEAHNFSVNDADPKNLKVVVSNMTGALIEGFGKSDLFSFSVVADEKFVESDSVVIKNVIFTDDNANTYEMVDSIGILVENVTDVYTRLQAELNKLQVNKDSAVAYVAKNCPDVNAEWVKVQTEKLQGQIDSLNNKLVEIKNAYAFEKETKAFEAGLAKTQEAVDSFKADADKLQAAFVANKRLNEAIAAAQENLDSVKAEVAKSCKDVASQFDAAFAAIQQDVDSLSASVKKAFEAGELTAESTVDTMAVNQAVAKVLAEAQAAQKAFEDKKAANEAAYERLNKVIAAVQDELDKAIAEIEKEYPNVADDFKADEKTIQEAIDELVASVKAQYEAVELNADSKVEVSSIRFAISKLLLDAEKAYIASGIDDVTTDGSLKIESVYTIDGKRVASPVKGLNIVKYVNGAVKKVYVK